MIEELRVAIIKAVIRYFLGCLPGLALVRGPNFITDCDGFPPWSAVALRTGSGCADIVGVTLPCNAILIEGVYRLGKSETPPGTWLGRSFDSMPHENKWSSTRHDINIAFVYDHSLIITGDKQMPYAINLKGDELRTFQNVPSANLPVNGPFVGLPIKSDGASVSYATCQDEVVIGVVASYTRNEDDFGNVNYTLRVRISDGPIVCPNIYFNTLDVGTPLYIIDYDNTVESVDDIYSNEEPAHGYSHPLLAVLDNSTLQYTGMRRPIVI